MRITPSGSCGLVCVWSDLLRKVTGDVVPKTGRELVLQWLYDEIKRAKTADLHRAAAFLEWARGIRAGCAKQRGGARMAQANGWRKYVDAPVRW